MICKVIETVEKFKLFENAKSVCVGVSGGADSVCLLDILFSLKEKYNYEIKVVHINHNLRGDEAKRDESFVKELCESYGVEFNLFSVDVASLAKEKGISVEECGRLVRYEAFDKMNCSVVAVAHTLSDCIETSLFNLSRGTALKGACGIPPKRDNIIRPLIDCTRAEIEAYLCKRGLSYIIDSSNLSDDYSRNYIRHNICKRFKEFNASFEKNYSRFIDSSRKENDFLESCARQLLERAKTEAGYSRGVMLAEHEAVLDRAVAALVSQLLEKSVERIHIELCLKAIKDGKGKIELAKNLYICVKDDIIRIQCKQPLAKSWQVDFNNRKATSPYFEYEAVEVLHTELEECKIKFLLDKDKLFGTLILRSRKEGDLFQSKSRNNTKTLKKLFNELRIPPENRNKIAVLTCDNNVAWVEGIGADGKFCADENTKTFIKIKRKAKI